MSGTSQTASGEGRMAASEFVQSQARALWLAMSNYKTIRSNVEGALADGEFELAALQARFGLQIGIRYVIAQRGLYYVDGGPFDILRSRFAEDDPVRVRAFQLDRRNPLSTEDVVAYCDECHEFVEQTCGLSVAAFTDASSRDDQIEAAISQMEDITELAAHLGVSLPWPAEDVKILRLLRTKLLHARCDAA